MLQPFAKTQKDQKQRVFSHRKSPFKRLRICLTDFLTQTMGALGSLRGLSLSSLSRRLRVYLVEICGCSFSLREWTPSKSTGDLQSSWENYFNSTLPTWTAMDRDCSVKAGSQIPKILQQEARWCNYSALDTLLILKRRGTKISEMGILLYIK